MTQHIYSCRRLLLLVNQPCRCGSASLGPGLSLCSWIGLFSGDLKVAEWLPEQAGGGADAVLEPDPEEEHKISRMEREHGLKFECGCRLEVTRSGPELVLTAALPRRQMASTGEPWNEDESGQWRHRGAPIRGSSG